MIQAVFLCYMIYIKAIYQHYLYALDSSKALSTVKAVELNVPKTL